MHLTILNQICFICDRVTDLVCILAELGVAFSTLIRPGTRVSNLLMSIELDIPLLRLKLLLLFSLTCPICPIRLPKTSVVIPLITRRSAYSMYRTPSTLPTTFHPPGRPAQSDLNLPSRPPTHLNSAYPVAHRS